jgi:hypothetical protein
MISNLVFAQTKPGTCDYVLKKESIVMALCTSPLTVGDDNRFFVYVEKEEGVVQFELKPEGAEVKFLEELDPNTAVYNFETGKIIVKGAGSFIVHTGPTDKLALIPSEKGIKILATDKCSSLVELMSYIIERKRQKGVDTKSPLEAFNGLILAGVGAFVSQSIHEMTFDPYTSELENRIVGPDVKTDPLIVDVSGESMGPTLLENVRLFVNPDGKDLTVYYAGSGVDFVRPYAATDASRFIFVDDKFSPSAPSTFADIIKRLGGEVRSTESAGDNKWIIKFLLKDRPRELILYDANAFTFTPSEMKDGIDVYFQKAGQNLAFDKVAGTSKYLKSNGFILTDVGLTGILESDIIGLEQINLDKMGKITFDEYGYGPLSVFVRSPQLDESTLSKFFDLDKALSKALTSKETSYFDDEHVDTFKTGITDAKKILDSFPQDVQEKVKLQMDYVLYFDDLPLYLMGKEGAKEFLEKIRSAYEDEFGKPSLNLLPNSFAYQVNSMRAILELNKEINKAIDEEDFASMAGLVKRADKLRSSIPPIEGREKLLQALDHNINLATQATETHFNNWNELEPLRTETNSATKNIFDDLIRVANDVGEESKRLSDGGHKPSAKAVKKVDDAGTNFMDATEDIDPEDPKLNAHADTLDSASNSDMNGRVPDEYKNSKKSALTKYESLIYGVGLTALFAIGPRLREYGHKVNDRVMLIAADAIQVAGFAIMATTFLTTVASVGLKIAVLKTAWMIATPSVMFVIMSALVDRIWCSFVDPSSTACGCSPSPVYDKTQLDIEKDKASAGEEIKFAIYGMQYCKGMIGLVTLEGLNTKYSSTRNTKIATGKNICKFIKDSCCEGSITLSDFSSADYTLLGYVDGSSAPQWLSENSVVEIVADSYVINPGSDPNNMANVISKTFSFVYKSDGKTLTVTGAEESKVACTQKSSDSWLCASPENTVLTCVQDNTDDPMSPWTCSMK